MGLAIKPATSVEFVVKYADFVDTLLVMTVEPGFGGQKFMHDMMPKVCCMSVYFLISASALRGILSEQLCAGLCNIKCSQSAAHLYE